MYSICRWIGIDLFQLFHNRAVPVMCIDRYDKEQQDVHVVCDCTD